MYIVTQNGNIVTNLQAVRARKEGIRGVIEIEFPDYEGYLIATYENINIAKAVVEELISAIESGKIIYRMPPENYQIPME